MMAKSKFVAYMVKRIGLGMDRKGGLGMSTRIFIVAAGMFVVGTWMSTGAFAAASPHCYVGT